jgi:toxin ParE1/3/4
MPYRLIVRKRAQSDIDSSCAWYESQERGVGLRFLDEVDGALRIIRERPAAFTVVKGSVHRMILNRFPFGIYYVCSGNTVSVLSVVHVARHPSTWPQGG